MSITVPGKRSGPLSIGGPVDVMLSDLAKDAGGGDGTKYLSGSGGFSTPGGGGGGATGATGATGPGGATGATGATGGGSLLSATVTLTSAQILNMATTPITLVAAPGAGKFIHAVSLTESFTFVTTSYTDGGFSAGVYYGDASGFGLDNFGLDAIIQSSSNQIAPNAISAAYNSARDATALINLPIVITDTSNPTLGDGTLKVTILYTVETL